MAAACLWFILTDSGSSHEAFFEFVRFVAAWKSRAVKSFGQNETKGGYSSGRFKDAELELVG